MPVAVQLMTVATVLALLGGVLWCARRFAPGVVTLAAFRSGIPAAKFRETARVSLTPQHRLHRVETPEGDSYLLATHPAGVTVLSARAAGFTSANGTAPASAAGQAT